MAGVESDRTKFRRIDRKEKGMLSEMGREIDKVRLSEHIDKLAKGGDLGRKIILEYYHKVGEEEDGKILAQREQMTVGYILPLKTDNTKHLMLFKTGDIAIVEASEESEGPTLLNELRDKGIIQAESTQEGEDEEGEAGLEMYRSQFSPSRTAAFTIDEGFVSDKDAVDVPEIVDSLINELESEDGEYVKVVHRNNSQQDLPFIRGALGAVMKVARKAKAEREQVKKESVSEAVDIFDREIGGQFYHPDQDSPYNLPPTE